MGWGLDSGHLSGTAEWESLASSPSVLSAKHWIRMWIQVDLDLGLQPLLG